MGAVVRAVVTPTPGDVQGVNMALTGRGYRGLDLGRLHRGVAREQRREEDITLRSVGVRRNMCVRRCGVWERLSVRECAWWSLPTPGMCRESTCPWPKEEEEAGGLDLGRLHSGVAREQRREEDITLRNARRHEMRLVRWLQVRETMHTRESVRVGDRGCLAARSSPPWMRRWSI